MKVSSKMNLLSVVVMVMVMREAEAASNAFITQVAGPQQNEQQVASEQRPTFGGFMEDIGFGNFFKDVGVEGSASAPSHSQVLPAASNQFPSLGGNFQFSLSSPGEMTKEQSQIQKVQGFMPSNPFGSASNLASSNIAPPDTFKNSAGLFGSSSNNFNFPKAFHSDISSFASGFGGESDGAKDQRKAVEEQPKKKQAGSHRHVEHRPRSRGQSASSFQPRYAQRRSDFGASDPFGGSTLFASPSKKEEKKNKGKCEVVEKDGMTCEVCNDAHGGFSEHCSHSQNSGKDSKFTNSRRQTTDDLLNPKDGKKAETPKHQKSQQRQVTRRQHPHQGGAQTAKHPADDQSFFDFSVPSGFDSSPYAQSRQDKVYDKKNDPFETFDAAPYDPFAQGSNIDPYKFEIPKFEDMDFDFGPEDHKKLVAESGLHERKDSQAPAPVKRSDSKHNKVAAKKHAPHAHPKPDPQENYKQLGQMVQKFGKKTRANCKKEIRKTMTCYICPNEHGKTDEECMFASKDPHSQHMMYTEESSYGNPQ